MKKYLAAVLVAAAIPAFWVGPAGAAVPKKGATQTLDCPGQPGKAARIWVSQKRGKLTKLAMDNPCSQSLWLSSEGHYAGGDAHDAMILKPGTHFNWGKERIAMYSWAIVYTEPHFEESSWECGGATTVAVVSKYNDVRYAQDDYGDSC